MFSPVNLFYIWICCAYLINDYPDYDSVSNVQCLVSNNVYQIIDDESNSSLSLNVVWCLQILCASLSDDYPEGRVLSQCPLSLTNLLPTGGHVTKPNSVTNGPANHQFKLHDHQDHTNRNSFVESTLPSTLKFRITAGPSLHDPWHDQWNMSLWSLLSQELWSLEFIRWTQLSCSLCDLLLLTRPMRNKVRRCI